MLEQSGFCLQSVTKEKRDIYTRLGRLLVEQDCRVIVVPAQTSAEEALAMDPDGVFLSNGPGDPSMAIDTIRILKKVMSVKKPIFGICLGSQLMGLASGAKTYKLPYGHRGQNQPCKNLLSGRCYLTSQNHGYAVNEKTLSKDWTVTFRNLNDNSVEGIAHKKLPFFSVQFHPEASPGPTDSTYLFKEFIDLL